MTETVTMELWHIALLYFALGTVCSSAMICEEIANGEVGDSPFVFINYLTKTALIGFPLMICAGAAALFRFVVSVRW